MVMQTKLFENIFVTLLQNVLKVIYANETVELYCLYLECNNVK